MSHMKYIKPQKKRKARKERKPSAIFPDGDRDTDASSRSTFHDLWGKSSNSTYSEASSIDSGNIQLSENMSLQTQDDFIQALGNLDMANPSRYSIPKGFGTKLSTIDIQITSPEQERSLPFSRPSCNTMIRHDTIENESSSDHNKKQEKEIIQSKSAGLQMNEQKSLFHMQLPSIDVISPSPTLSVFSDRQILTDSQFDSLLRPSLSRMSGRTLTPLSSLSSSSTMSDPYSQTSGSSEDGLLGKRDLPRKQVLPPIRKNSFAQQSSYTMPLTMVKKIKTDMRSRKTKTKSHSENTGRTSSCSSEDSVGKSNRQEIRKTTHSEKIGTISLKKEARGIKSKQADFTRNLSEPIEKSGSYPQNKKELTKKMSSNRLLLRRDVKKIDDSDKKEDIKTPSSPRHLSLFRSDVTLNRPTLHGTKNGRGRLPKTTQKRQKQDKDRSNVNDTIK